MYRGPTCGPCPDFCKMSELEEGPSVYKGYLIFSVCVCVQRIPGVCVCGFVCVFNCMSGGEEGSSSYK